MRPRSTTRPVWSSCRQPCRRRAAALPRARRRRALSSQLRPARPKRRYSQGSRNKRKRAAPETSTPSHPCGRLGVEWLVGPRYPSGQRGPPDHFWVTFLAAAFLAGAFLAGAFLAGAFLATAFWAFLAAASAFFGSSMPTRFAGRPPTRR